MEYFVSQNYHRRTSKLVYRKQLLIEIYVRAPQGQTQRVGCGGSCPTQFLNLLILSSLNSVLSPLKSSN
jgi:hypothetical protein